MMGLASCLDYTTRGRDRLRGLVLSSLGLHLAANPVHGADPAAERSSDVLGLRAGTKPKDVAATLGCGVSTVYRVRREMQVEAGEDQAA